jgi:CheY-like chemotaxis protein
MASKAQGSPVKALLVEDAPVDALVLSAMLGMFHCETTVALNGKEAVDLFLEGKKFDIVFCDRDMPVMNGPEVL